MKPEKKAKLKKVLKITGLVAGGTIAGIIIGKATNGKENTEVVTVKKKDDVINKYAEFTTDLLVWCCENNGGKYVISNHRNEEGLTDKLLVAQIVDVEPGATSVSAE